MRIIIYGAGAIGSILGGYLHESGQETILICSKKHAEAISHDGLRISGFQGDHHVRLPAVADVASTEIRESDIVFLTMKTFDTEAAIGRLAGKAMRMAAVCFQNSVRNEEIAAERFDRVYGGIAFLGAKYLKPGSVIHTAENSLGIGLYPEGVDRTVETLSEALTKAGFSVTNYSKIMAVKWAKLFGNLNNAMHGITGLSILEGIKYEEPRLLMADTLKEALHVIEADGIEIVPLEGQRTPEEIIARLDKAGDLSFDIPQDEKSQIRPSTWQDLHLKRGRTEVEYFNGEIVRLGEKHDIPTPINSLLLRITNQMAEAKIQPGAYTPAQLRAMLKT